MTSYSSSTDTLSLSRTVNEIQKHLCPKYQLLPTSSIGRPGSNGTPSPIRFIFGPRKLETLSYNPAKVT